MAQIGAEMIGAIECPLKLACLTLQSLYTRVMPILMLNMMFNIHRIMFLALKRFEWSKSLLVKYPLPNKKIPFPANCQDMLQVYL